MNKSSFIIFTIKEKHTIHFVSNSKNGLLLLMYFRYRKQTFLNDSSVHRVERNGIIVAADTEISRI